MARKPTGNPNGRPLTKIDQKTFEGLCEIQCTKNEIASVLKCSGDCISDWCQRTYGVTFADIYKTFAEVGKASLRRAQLKIAQKNASMAIFLGKQYLGQKDVIEQQEISRIQIINDVPKEEIEDEED